MRPRRDYDEYTKFINDTFVSEKESLVNGTVDHMNKTGGFESAKTNPLDTLKTFTEKDLSLSASTKLRASVEGADYVVVSTPTNYDERTNLFDTSSVELVIAQVIESEPNACIVLKSTIQLVSLMT